VSPGPVGTGRRQTAVWSAVAERDLDAIYEYLRVRTRTGTRTVVEGILTAVERLEEMPGMGERAEWIEPEGDLRQFPWRNYIVFYRATDRGLVVLRVWDSRRDPETLILQMAPEETGLRGPSKR